MRCLLLRTDRERGFQHPGYAAQVCIELAALVDIIMSSADRSTRSELRSCVNRDVGLGCHFLSHSFPVPNNPHGFCGSTP